MATFNATLSIVSPDVLSSSLSLSVGISSTVDSGHLSKVKVAATSSTGSQTIYKGNDKIGPTYLYIKNLGVEREHYAYVYVDDNSDTPFLKIPGNEFAFLTVNSEHTLKAYVTTVDQMIEYGVFGLDSSSVILS